MPPLFLFLILSWVPLTNKNIDFISPPTTPSFSKQKHSKNTNIVVVHHLTQILNFFFYFKISKNISLLNTIRPARQPCMWNSTSPASRIKQDPWSRKGINQQKREFQAKAEDTAWRGARTIRTTPSSIDKYSESGEFCYIKFF